MAVCSIFLQADGTPVEYAVMKLAHSVVVAKDGESKCGKTTLIKAVAEQAHRQAEAVPSFVARQLGERAILNTTDCAKLLAWHSAVVFRQIIELSAGNYFRAASLLEISGPSRERFDASDIPKLRKLMATDGVTEILQNDERVARHVSVVAKIPGVQTLCGAMFSGAIQEAYDAEGGSNLVIVDARDPVGILQRAGRIGGEYGQIEPATILPVYIDTPPETAARRLQGEYTENLAIVAGRRHTDATRAELPVRRPAQLIDSYDIWSSQFDPPHIGGPVAIPYRYDNGETCRLDDIPVFAANVATLAQGVSLAVTHFRGVHA